VGSCFWCISMLLKSSFREFLFVFNNTKEILKVLSELVFVHFVVNSLNLFLCIWEKEKHRERKKK
jgi:hypothetical protein